MRLAPRDARKLVHSVHVVLALLSLAILDLVVQPHVDPGRLVEAPHHAWTADSRPAHGDRANGQAAGAGPAGRADAQLEPSDAPRSACLICDAQDVNGSPLGLGAGAAAAPPPPAVPAAPPDDPGPGRFAGRSWRSRAPPLHG